jgi:hypothetical protein
MDTRSDTEPTHPNGVGDSNHPTQPNRVGHNHEHENDLDSNEDPPAEEWGLDSFEGPKKSGNRGG